MLKTVIALAVVAGFSTASFAQPAVSAPVAAPVAKTAAPAPVTEKKAEAPKAVEAMKVETPVAEATKPVHKPAKAKPHGKKAVAEKSEAPVAR